MRDHLRHIGDFAVAELETGFFTRSRVLKHGFHARSCQILKRKCVKLLLASVAAKTGRKAFSSKPLDNRTCASLPRSSTGEGRSFRPQTICGGSRQMLALCPAVRSTRFPASWSRPGLGFTGCSRDFSLPQSVEQDMETRRNLREDMLREEMLVEALQYVASVNHVIKTSVEAAAARVKAQYAA